MVTQPVPLLHTNPKVAGLQQIPSMASFNHQLELGGLLAPMQLPTKLQ